MNDKQKLAAIGAQYRLTEEQAKGLAERMPQTGALQVIDDEPLCMAKRIEELEAQVRVMAELLREAQECVVHDVVRGMGRDVESLWARIDATLAGNLPIRYEVPEGWQLVPVEPTENMIGHGCGASVMVVSEVIKAWAAMLAAAPKPECCRPVAMTDMRFVVCPDCGNKRCPRANDHRNACTGSNELGQEGSAYPAAPKQQGGEPCASEPPSSSPD